jgi:general secretion pathway protein E
LSIRTPSILNLAHTYEQVLNLTKLNQGLVVVTGPTGSGKTTLLYALLSDINNQQLGVSIQTLEDPVEKKLPGLDQCSINKDAGTTYERGLVAFLRQDLDAALIGEIRDETTAKKVTEVAMTGHLALTTLHTNTALGTINRLRRLGIDDRDTADTLKSSLAH